MGKINRDKKILIIDPDRKERKCLQLYLKKEEYLVETGGNLADAIKKISEHCYDCLILDVALPEMKGYDAVPILKHIDPDVRIILTTKKNSKKLESKVREQNIFFYYIKSFGKDELKLAIRNAFEPISIENKGEKNEGE
ncbi:MAG: response regulator [Candidatus Aminicenantes bacterium]|nr:response regulator [Candidatus Aminicenantes bacterium]